MSKGSDHIGGLNELPQVFPTKVAAAKFTLVLTVMTCAIITPAFQVSVIDVRVKAFAS